MSMTAIRAACLVATIVGSTVPVHASGWEGRRDEPAGPPPVILFAPAFEEPGAGDRHRAYRYSSPPTTFVPYSYYNPITGRVRYYLHSYRTYRR